MSIRSSILRRGGCILLLTSAVTFQAASRQTQQEASVEQLAQSIARIKKTFGVQVHYLYDRNTYFADDWREAPVKAEGKQIDLGEALRTLPIVEAFLAGYPKAVLAENLRDVFLVLSMSFYGQEFGGTSSADGVYITNDGENEGYTRQYLESTMHDEFSSILFRNYDFPQAEWGQVNERGWKYVGYGKDFDVLCRTDLFDSSEAL